MAETQKFYREAVASLATFRMYAAPDRGNGFSDMHNLASFLLGEDIFDLQVAQYAPWLQAAVRAQYPDMPAEDVYEPDALKGFPLMLSVERPENPPANPGSIGACIEWINSERAKKDLPPAAISVLAPDLAKAHSND